MPRQQLHSISRQNFRLPEVPADCQFSPLPNRRVRFRRERSFRPVATGRLHSLSHLLRDNKHDHGKTYKDKVGLKGPPAPPPPHLKKWYLQFIFGFCVKFDENCHLRELFQIALF